MDEIKITLETLYDFLRNEKKREELQPLMESFYDDVAAYILEKKNLLKGDEDDDELFAAKEKRQLQNELRSIKRIVKELYEKREQKLFEIALNRSRTGSDIIDTSAMLPVEKEFYEMLLVNLDSYRVRVLNAIFKGRKKPEEGKQRIKFIRPCPSFVWKDLQTYGPFE